jgi:type IV pilus assembly protein PilV
MLLLAIGVLGAASMQLNSLKYNQLAMTRSQAMLAAYSILDSMRANPTGVTQGQYNTNNSGNAGTVAASDLTAWQNTLALFNATGTIASTTVSTKQQVTITVSWDQSRGPVVKGQSQPDASMGRIQVISLL